jgi:hypothetical protein
MVNKIIDRTKKVLVISLLALFITSLTATAVSAYNANFDSTWGPVSKQNYWNAYSNQASAGSNAGIQYGQTDGRNDCQTGQNSNPLGYWKYHRSTSYTSAAALGAVDGYNDWFDYQYQQQYTQAYNACINAGQQNQQIRAT